MGVGGGGSRSFFVNVGVNGVLTGKLGGLVESTVCWIGEKRYQLLFVWRSGSCHNGKAPDEFRFEGEAGEGFRCHHLEGFRAVGLVRS